MDKLLLWVCKST